MKIIDIKLTGETDGSGDKTVTSTRSVKGFLYKVKWVDGDLVDACTGVLTVTETPESVDETLLTLANPKGNADKNYYPRDLVHGLDGTALTGTAGGDRIELLVVGKLKLVIGAGGDTKTGGCHVYIKEAD